MAAKKSASAGEQIIMLHAPAAPTTISIDEVFRSGLWCWSAAKVKSRRDGKANRGSIRLRAHSQRA
jgi:hypothetical protein